MSTVTIRNIGPITELSVPISPGVTVLRGRNESGKSTAIRSLEALSGTKTKLEVRDGEKTGLVDGGGIIMTVGQRTTRTGELEFRSIEERLDIGSLVDPGMADPKAANRRRIKALLSLSKTKLEVNDFRRLLPEELNDEVLSETDATADPVELAARIKRRLERHAREASERATKHQTESRVLKAKLEDLPEAVGISEAEASRQLEQAIARRAEVRSEHKAAEQAHERYVAAKAKLQQHGEVSAVVPEAQRHAAEAQAEVARHLQQIATYEQLLAQQRQKLAEAELRLSAAEDRVKAAQDQDALLSKWRETVELGLIDGPSDDDLAEAEAAVEAATKQVHAARESRLVQDVKRKLEQSEDEYRLARKLEGIFRNAARGTDEILSEAVDSPLFKVIKGELFYVEDGRSEAFARLSDGKRWQIAVSVAARALGQDDATIGIIPLSQVAWEGLDSSNRDLVLQAALNNNVAIVTAEKSDGELEAVGLN